MQSAAKQQKDRRTLRIEQRAADFEVLTVALKLELAEDHFSAAIGKFREAVNLSRGINDLEEAVVRQAMELATELLPRSSCLAKSLLHEAEEVDSRKLIPRELWKTVHDREREDAISMALTAADAASSTKSMLPPVRQRLAVLAARYPGESRLQTKLKAVDALAALQTDGERLLQEEKCAKLAEANQLLARAAWARSREFYKGGFSEEALDQLRTLREIDPSFPGLDAEIKRCSPGETALVLSTPAIPAVLDKLRPSKAAKTSNWRYVGTAATLIVTVATLTTAGGLLWMQHSNRTVAPAIHRTATLIVPNAEEQAWASVNVKDVDLVEDYLTRFPNGSNRSLAVQALSEIRVERRQSAEVRSVLRQYQAAWNTRNIDSILSLQRDLNRQALQARLSPLKSMVMHISPAANPLIEGDLATIRCLRTTSEVYEDGVEKRTPAQPVTFVLARHGSGWIIQSARQ